MRQILSISPFIDVEVQLTYAHYNTVAEPLRMKHVLIWEKTEISQHLNRLGILKYNVFSFAHAFHEMLMNDLPERSPSATMIHHQQMIASCNKIVRNI